MTNFDDVKIFGNTSLADLFKQIHKNNKDTDKQISEFIDTLRPMATQTPGYAIELMPTVKDLIDVNVKNNDQLIKIAGIAQRAASSTQTQDVGFIDMDEINALLEEQKEVQEQSNKLLDQVPSIPQLEQK
jgi:hypothetical protein